MALNDRIELVTEDDIYLATLPFRTEAKSQENKIMIRLHEDKVDHDGLLMGTHPLALAARANDEDTPNYFEAMNSSDAEGFYEAMKKEIEQLKSMDAWEEVPCEEAEGKNILPSTWAFKRKRYPDGRVRKLKARFCVRGDRQIEGVDFFETYAPVVAWSTVRLLLVLSVVLGLATKQVDYTLAFIHAPIDDEVFIEMPKGFTRPGYLYKLKRSVYGLRQSPLNWFLTLKSGLEERGFKQSILDPCLFQTDKVTCLVYVDDCLFFARDERDIDEVLNDLKSPNDESHQSFLLNVESAVAGFLGILLNRNDNGTIELKQEGLIDRILSVMGLKDASIKFTLAEAKCLGKDEGGQACQELWSYPSIVGMMMYLASNSRPDIVFAVHQCARFTHCPRQTNEKALKRISRYLKGTKDQ